MPFTATEQRFLLHRAKEKRRQAGGGLNITKAQLAACFDAILGTWESNQYKNSQSNALDQAVSGLSIAEKKALHELAAEMASEWGYF